MSKWDRFLTSLEFELAYTPVDLSAVARLPIRDPADLSTPVSAMIPQPDILVTGDKDFHAPEIQTSFSVLTPSDFLKPQPRNVVIGMIRAPFNS